jgi:hypothetical protein
MFDKMVASLHDLNRRRDHLQVSAVGKVVASTP